MNRYFTLWISLLLLPFLLPAQIELVEPPLNPAWVEYMEKLERGEIRLKTEDGYYMGYIPPKYLPFDPNTLRTVEESTLEEAALPERFDLREEGRVTPARDQGACGSCWAFGAMSALESNLLTDGYGPWDLAEDQFLDCSGEENPCEGSAISTTFSVLVTGIGPLFEEDDPYTPFTKDCPSGYFPPVLVTDIRHVNIYQMEVFKSLIMREGALGVSLPFGPGYFDNSTNIWYEPEKLVASHCVALVGWDDNLLTENGKGAWIAKNSWGESWGENGFFYIDYGVEILTATFFPEAIPSNGIVVHTYMDNSPFGGREVRVNSRRALSLTEFTADLEQEIHGINAYIEFGYEVSAEIYSTFDGNVLSGKLGQTQSIKTPSGDPYLLHGGYYSLPLDASFTIQPKQKFYLKVTYQSLREPDFKRTTLLSDDTGVIESGKNWVSEDGNSWTPIGKGTEYPVDLRVQAYGRATDRITPSFTLVNSRSDQDIQRLEDGDVLRLSETGKYLNVRADFPGVSPLGSVVFYLDGNKVRTENVAPYALYGDSPPGNYRDWTPQQGKTYRLKAVPYALSNGKGAAGEALEITFSVDTEVEEIAFTVMNSETDTEHLEDIEYLPEKQYIRMALPNHPINVRADIEPVGSVVFYLNGKKVRTENVAPYALFGDSPLGDYRDWYPNWGTYTIRAIPFSGKNGTGVAGPVREIRLQVYPKNLFLETEPVTVQQEKLTPITMTMEPGAAPRPTLGHGPIGKVFPNPTTGIVRLLLDPTLSLPVGVRVYDPLGRLVYRLPETIDRQIEIDLNGLSPSDGLFLIEWTNGRERQVRRVLKVRR